MNWRLKIASKILLSRLGLPYQRWRRLGLFRLGRMDSPVYAQKIFDIHIRRAFPEGELGGRTVLELGPGDSLASAVFASAQGATETILVDAGDFASSDVALYQSMAKMTAEAGLLAPTLEGASDLDDVLRRCSARYLKDGVQSFSTLRAESVDLIWSHSVMEHIPLLELPLLMSEMRRVLKPGGLMSHNIDFQDHLAHALNSLRFSQATWEAPLMRDAGFYTNRIRARTMHAMIRDAGFEIVREGFGRWPELPTPKAALDSQFRNLDEEELLIRTSHVLARAI